MDLFRAIFTITGESKSWNTNRTMTSEKMHGYIWDGA